MEIPLSYVYPQNFEFDEAKEITKAFSNEAACDCILGKSK